MDDGQLSENQEMAKIEPLNLCVSVACNTVDPVPNSEMVYKRDKLMQPVCIINNNIFGWDFTDNFNDSELSVCSS